MSDINTPQVTPDVTPTVTVTNTGSPTPTNTLTSTRGLSGLPEPTRTPTASHTPTRTVTVTPSRSFVDVNLPIVVVPPSEIPSNDGSPYTSLLICTSGSGWVHGQSASVVAFYAITDLSLSSTAVPAVTAIVNPVPNTFINERCAVISGLDAGTNYYLYATNDLYQISDLIEYQTAAPIAPTPTPTSTVPLVTAIYVSPTPTKTVTSTPTSTNLPTQTVTPTRTVTNSRTNSPTPTITRSVTRSAVPSTPTKTPTPTRRPAVPAAPFVSSVVITNHATPQTASLAVLRIGISKPSNYTYSAIPVTYVITVKNIKNNAIKTYTFSSTDNSVYYDAGGLPAINLATPVCALSVLGNCQKWVNNITPNTHTTNTYQVSVRPIAYGIQGAISNVVTIPVES